jgi:Domain of unknown function (DUF1905)
MDSDRTFTCTATVWLWKSAAKPDAAGWYFATIDPQTAAEIKYAVLGMARAFGSVKVTAQIGATRWQTSLFPNKETGGYLLPLKASVRTAEGLKVEDAVAVTLVV